MSEPDDTPDPIPTLTEPQHIARQAIAEAERAVQAAESERERITFGQRRVNLIWEVTQALIALMVTGTTLFASVSLVLRGAADAAAFLLLSNAFFLVVGFYFGRTNHQRTGGVGPGDYGR